MKNVFCEYLNDYFASAGAKSKTQVAVEADISRKYLHELINDPEKEVSLQKAQRVALAVGTSLAEILQSEPLAAAG